MRYEGVKRDMDWLLCVLVAGKEQLVYLSD